MPCLRKRVWKRPFDGRLVETDTREIAHCGEQHQPVVADSLAARLRAEHRDWPLPVLLSAGLATGTPWRTTAPYGGLAATSPRPCRLSAEAHLSPSIQPHGEAQLAHARAAFGAAVRRGR